MQEVQGKSSIAERIDAEGVAHAVNTEVAIKAYMLFAKPGDSLAAAARRGLKKVLELEDEDVDLPSLALAGAVRIARLQDKNYSRWRRVDVDGLPESPGMFVLAVRVQGDKVGVCACVYDPEGGDPADLSSATYWQPLDLPTF